MQILMQILPSKIPDPAHYTFRKGSVRSKVYLSANVTEFYNTIALSVCITIITRIGLCGREV